MVDIINNLWMEEPDIEFFSETVMDLKNRISNSIEDVKGVKDFKLNMKVKNNGKVNFSVESWSLTHKEDELDVSSLINSISEVEDIEYRSMKINGNNELNIEFSHESGE